MRARSILAFSLFILLGAGCAPAPTTPAPAPTIQQPPTSPVPSDSSDPLGSSGSSKIPMSYFSDDELGVAFYYPTAWGTARAESETGEGGCLYQRVVMIDHEQALLRGMTVVAGSNPDCPRAERPFYFGDASADYSEDMAFLAPCEADEASVCDVYKNGKGATFWHWHYDIAPYEYAAENVDEYGLYRKYNIYKGVVFSNNRLREFGLDADGSGFKALIDSVVFSK